MGKASDQQRASSSAAGRAQAERNKQASGNLTVRAAIEIRRFNPLTTLGSPVTHEVNNFQLEYLSSQAMIILFLLSVWVICTK